MLIDKTLQRILEKKETPDPPDNLEDRIMLKISKVSRQNTVNKKYLVLAWFFFVFGLTAGIMISTVFVNRDTIIFGLNFSEHGFFTQILCSLIILFLFERLFNLTLESRNK
jgi:hypothetical protein